MEAGMACFACVCQPAVRSLHITTGTAPTAVEHATDSPGLPSLRSAVAWKRPHTVKRSEVQDVQTKLELYELSPSVPMSSLFKTQQFQNLSWAKTLETVYYEKKWYLAKLHGQVRPSATQPSIYPLLARPRVLKHEVLCQTAWSDTPIYDSSRYLLTPSLRVPLNTRYPAKLHGQIPQSTTHPGIYLYLAWECPQTLGTLPNCMAKYPLLQLNPVSTLS